MDSKKIFTENAPKAIGPYSQAIVFEKLVFCAAQIGLNPENGLLVEGGIEAQTEQVCKNLKAVLEASGSSIENVLKTTVFLKNMADFQAMNVVYEKFFIGKPARATVEVSALPKNALVEIECIAFIDWVFA